MAEEQQSEVDTEAQGGGEAETQGGFSEAFAERANPSAASEHNPDDKAAGAEPAAREEPAEQAGSQAPSEEAASGTSGTAQTDPWEGLTPEQRERISKLEQSERSNRGRVGALTKQLNERLNGTHQPPKQAAEEQPSERNDEGGESDKGEASDIEARLKAVRDEYGDIVGPVADVIDELRSEVAGLKASATRHQVDTDAAALTEAYATLESNHPDYRDIPAKPEFAEWYGKQPKGVQALFNSYDPQEVSLALTFFKTETAATSSSEASTETDKGGDGGTATGDKRERQLEGLKQPVGRGAAVSGVPNDFKSGFAARAAQQQR